MVFSIPRGVTIALRRSAALPFLVGAVAAAGCASSEDVEFVDGYNAAVAPLSTTLSSMDSSLSGDDPAAASKSLNKVADQLVDVRADLAGLHPPKDAADEFDRLLGALDKAPKQVRAMAKATKEGNLKRLGKATARLSATGTKLVTIEQELRTIVED